MAVYKKPWHKRMISTIVLDQSSLRSYLAH
jgi:hypothetical protein